MSDDNPIPERMLAISVKKTDPVDLHRPLRKLVARKYSESDAQKVESVLETLNNCRRDMVEPRDLSLVMQRECLMHYFKCLCMVEPLFTTISSAADADSDPIILVWYDAFYSEHEGGVSSQRNSIQLEKAAVVFNLGALCSQIGASCDRTTALGRNLAMDAFNDAANFFLKLWKVFATDVSATLDLTLLFAESLHCLFSAQVLELNLQQQQLVNNSNSSALQNHLCAVSFKSVSKHYRRAYDLIQSDSAVTQHVSSFDQTWITHLYQKVKFFEEEAKTFSFDHDAESLTEKLVKGICRRAYQWIPKPEGIYLDLILSEYSPFEIIHGGKLVSNPYGMPPYPTNFAIPSSSSSSSSHILALPLKKSEPLDLYQSLRNYFVLKYSESVANRVEGLLEMLNKLRSEMLRDDLSLPMRRDCLIRYFKCLCMIEPLFPMTSSPNPPIFVWYDAFYPQRNSSQHNIHLEKASVLFNLGALGSHIASSCHLTTIQGRRIALDALHDASYWFLILTHEAEKASATTDLSISCAQMLRQIITAQIAYLECDFPHSHGSSLPQYPVSRLYRKLYDLTTFGPLAENLAQSSIPQFVESKMKTCHVQTGPIDITELFLSGYCAAQSLLREGCQTSCSDLLFEDGPCKITYGILWPSLEALALALEGMNLSENTPMEEN